MVGVGRDLCGSSSAAVGHLVQPSKVLQRCQCRGVGTTSQPWGGGRTQHPAGWGSSAPDLANSHFIVLVSFFFFPFLSSTKSKIFRAQRKLHLAIGLCASAWTAPALPALTRRPPAGNHFLHPCRPPTAPGWDVTPLHRARFQSRCLNTPEPGPLWPSSLQSLQPTAGLMVGLDDLRGLFQPTML